MPRFLHRPITAVVFTACKMRFYQGGVQPSYVLGQPDDLSSVGYYGPFPVWLIRQLIRLKHLVAHLGTSSSSSSEAVMLSGVQSSLFECT